MDTFGKLSYRHGTASDVHVLNCVFSFISRVISFVVDFPTTPIMSLDELTDPDIPSTVFEQVFISAELIRHSLTLAAFPLLTGLYGYRGYKGGPLEPSKLEKKAMDCFDVDIESLNEWYSPLVPISWLVTKFTANSLGLVAFAWRDTMDLLPEDMPATLRFLDLTGLIGDAVSWTSGFIGFGALGIWIYRRQERRRKDKSLRMIGPPEISLVLHTVAFAAYVWIPCNDFMWNGLQQFLRAEGCV